MMETSTKQTANQLHHETRDVRQALEKVVKDNAAGSAAIVFGLGIGAGLAIAGLINNSMQTKHRSLAQRIGEQVLNSVHSVMPDSLYNR